MNPEPDQTFPPAEAWACRSCGLNMTFAEADPGLGEHGRYFFVCPDCGAHNALANISLEGDVADLVQLND